MWSRPDGYAAGLRGAVVAAVMSAALAGLGGCGFKPLYGVSADGTEVTEELSYIGIPERRDRLSQLIRNKLLSTMSPPGGPIGERYVLEFVPRVKTDDVVIQDDSDVSRRLYKLSVEYRLIDKESRKVVHEGRTFSHVSYDRVRDEFANIQAETDVKERASIQVADDIRTRLAAYFASR